MRFSGWGQQTSTLGSRFIALLFYTDMLFEQHQRKPMGLNLHVTGEK
jgi:hypothetical protein